MRPAAEGIRRNNTMQSFRRRKEHFLPFDLKTMEDYTEEAYPHLFLSLAAQRNKNNPHFSLMLPYILFLIINFLFDEVIVVVSDDTWGRCPRKDIDYT